MPKIQTKKVLIVDDVKALRKAITFQFEEQGFATLEASTATEALTLCSRECVDVIVSDVRMPGGTGLDLLDALRRNHFKNPPFILMSAFSDISIEIALARGADGIFQKPFKSQFVVDSAKAVLTPKEVLWSQSGPRDGAFMIKRTFENLATVNFAKENHVLVGRGGLFIPLEETFPTMDQIVEIDFEFKAGSIEHLKGCGRVRWVRGMSSNAAATGVGIELMAVEANCIPGLIDLIEASQVVSYVPNGI